MSASQHINTSLFVIRLFGVHYSIRLIALTRSEQQNIEQLNIECPSAGWSIAMIGSRRWKHNHGRSDEDYVSTPAHLPFEDKVHSQHEENEANEVIEPECFILEKYQGENDKDHQSDHFLDNLELDQAEGSPEFAEADPVGRYLEHIFKESDAPTEEDDADQSEVLTPRHLLEAQVAVPGEGHEGVGRGEHDNSNQGFHR